MVEVTKTVRNVDADTFRTFRAKAVEMGYSTGAALTEAIRQWVNVKNRPRYVVRADSGAEARSPLDEPVPA